MRKAARWRSEWGWFAAIALLLTLGIWWIPGSGGIDDSFSADEGGKKAFFTLVEAFFPGARRSLERLPPSADNPATLCLIGPARTPDPQEWLDLYQWVFRGNSLVFAVRADDPVADLEPFGIRIAMESRPLMEGRGDGDDDDFSSRFEAPALRPGLAEGSFEWGTQGYLAGDFDDEEVLVRVRGGPQVVSQSVGNGWVVLSASDAIFSNLALSRKDNGILAFRLLESAHRGGPIYFDETLNAAGLPKVFGLLFDPPFRAITLQLLICAALFGWWGHKRFGPPLWGSEPTRRSIAEHAEALGNLHYKAGTGAQAVASYLEFFRNEARAQLASSGDERLAEALARRAGIDASKVAALLAEARRGAAQAKLPASSAAALIRALAGLRRKLELTRAIPKAGGSHGT